MLIVYTRSNKPPFPSSSHPWPNCLGERAESVSLRLWAVGARAMGGAHSRADVESWTAERVAELVGQIGGNYKKYGESIRDNGIDGRMLLDLQAESILDELGISSNIHRTRFKNELSKLHSRTSSEQGQADSSSAIGMSLEAGTVLVNNFELETELGSGGMGLVWRARDMTLHRQVAIKFAKSGGSAEDDRRLEQRMKQEVKAVAQCTHPNIMAIHNACLGEEEPVKFIVCEHLGDISLQTLLSDRSPRLSPHNLLVVAEQLLQALSHMHSKNWIHRDMKPSNVMWSQAEKGSFKVVLIDFGIAKNRSEQSNVMPTTTGGFPGTLAYMGPLARSGILDVRSDLWALAITIAQCLMGEVEGEAHALELLANAVAGMPPTQEQLQRKSEGVANDEELQVRV